MFIFSCKIFNLAKKSKRVSCAHRYSIAKKVRAHNKKVRKEARKHPEFKSNTRKLNLIDETNFSI